LATHTQPPRRQTPSPEGNATYIDFTKLNEGRFLLARINRSNSHWFLSLPYPPLYYLLLDWRGETLLLGEVNIVRGLSAGGYPPPTDPLPRVVFKKFPMLYQLSLPKPCFLASLTSPLPSLSSPSHWYKCQVPECDRSDLSPDWGAD